MSAVKKDIYLDAGTTFSTDIYLTDNNGDVINLNSYTANSVFKKWYTSALSIPFNVVVNGNAGIVTLNLSAITSANLDPGRYVYDVNLFQTGTSNVIRIVEGVVTINPAVTDGQYLTNNTDDY